MKSNIEWQQWGKRDPRFGVLTWPGKERGGIAEWTDEEFYAVGASDWEDFATRWKRYGMNPTACVEIGCGVGRLTKYIARSFAHVHALDVSANMIAYAQENVDIENITYYVTSGSHIPIPDNSVGGVFSTHVFQHFDSPDDAAKYFEEAFRVLSPGGTMMIHLPVHDFPSKTSAFTRIIRKLYALRKGVSNIHAAAKRFMIRHGSDVILMRNLSYEVAWIFSILEKTGFRDVEILQFTVRSSRSVHPVVLARR